ncbi:DedA family protein [Halalkalibacter nanhaiisediminis]|uniref:Membrane protein DedA with SNARE-associated domain n=1 Tax=Halalkalibacter nanhaiisediminis TaxID=688079 RepID=A0A562QSJ6_9BACI|nr:DedA family protein [Halalkalibacter nanhaiisediminis]TWI59685.1 membrane protein DedA with SNARE-associated domain [Halalkalibacter nanhaiisediminis]
MEQFILLLIESFKQLSYLGVVLALTLEFVPAELVLPLVGYWVYQGDMRLTLAILAGTIGGTFGPLTLYALGRYGGRPMIVKYGKFFLIKEKHIEASDRFFEKHGASVAFFARFLPGVRTAISIPCGIAKMNVWKFSIYTFLAMLPITSIYIYLGYMFGPHWEQVGPLVKTYMLPISIILIILILFYFLFKKYIAKNSVSTVRKK